MRLAPRSLSDEALVKECDLLPWERKLHRFAWSGTGCATGWVVALGPAFLCSLLIRPWNLHPLPAAVIGTAVMVTSVSLYILLVSTAQRRRKPYWRELQRRYAGLPLDEYVREADSHSGDACITLTGSNPPADAAWLVHVTLHGDGDGYAVAGKIERRELSPAWALGESPGPVTMASADLQLDAPQAEALRLLANRAVADGSRSVSSTVIDGAPAELAVWVRRRGLVLRGRCNLAGVSAANESLPVVQLMRRV
jgi:hypothetical protein